MLRTAAGVAAGSGRRRPSDSDTRGVRSPACSDRCSDTADRTDRSARPCCIHAAVAATADMAAGAAHVVSAADRRADSSAMCQCSAALAEPRATGAADADRCCMGAAVSQSGIDFRVCVCLRLSRCPADRVDFPARRPRVVTDAAAGPADRNFIRLFFWSSAAVMLLRGLMPRNARRLLLVCFPVKPMQQTVSHRSHHDGGRDNEQQPGRQSITACKQLAG